MGGGLSQEEDSISHLNRTSGTDFPGCYDRPGDRKNWMLGLDPRKLRINQIAWPGTHDSATNQIADPIFVRPFAECQTLSIYDQLVRGTRVLDIRVQQDRWVCHGDILTYGVDVVIGDIKRFLSETQSEIIILEVRTEFGHQDPPGFDAYLEDQLGEHLIHQDDGVFNMTVADLLPRRVICVWKPRNSPQPRAGGPLWCSGHLRDDWMNTDLPMTKFEGNMSHLSQQPPARDRNFFYRVENTLTPQFGSHCLYVGVVTARIHGYARLFISQCFSRGLADRLQILSTDYITEDFVDACFGLTYARVQGWA